MTPVGYEHHVGDHTIGRRIEALAQQLRHVVEIAAAIRFEIDVV
jgi:hypothetical protein